MRKTVILIVVLLLTVAGCRSGPSIYVEEPRMTRVVLAPMHTTQELQAEVGLLVGRLRAGSEVIYKDDFEGMKSDTVNRLVEIGQPAVPALIEGYYEALQRHDELHFRYLVLAIFQRMREPMTQDFLIQVLRRGDRKERRLAAEALWWFGDTTCVGLLINALDDDSLDVVNTVATALRAITGFSFGIYRNLGDTQRDEAIKRWRQWWSVTGFAFPRGRVDKF